VFAAAEHVEGEVRSAPHADLIRQARQFERAAFAALALNGGADHLAALEQRYGVPGFGWRLRRLQLAAYYGWTLREIDALPPADLADALAYLAALAKFRSTERS
jgi:hypothetical protein